MANRYAHRYVRSLQMAQHIEDLAFLSCQISSLPSLETLSKILDRRLQTLKAVGDSVYTSSVDLQKPAISSLWSQSPLRLYLPHLVLKTFFLRLRASGYEIDISFLTRFRRGTFPMTGDNYYYMQIPSTVLSRPMIQESLTYRPLACPQGFVSSVHSVHQSGDARLY